MLGTASKPAMFCLRWRSWIFNNIVVKFSRKSSTDNRSRAMPAATVTTLRAAAAPEQPLAFGEVLFMRERHVALLYEAVIKALLRVKQTEGLTDEGLATRLGKTPEEIDRLLASPVGWTFETVSDLLTAAGLDFGPMRIVPRSLRS
jgi:DNA-binding phage protein